MTGIVFVIESDVKSFRKLIFIIYYQRSPKKIKLTFSSDFIVKNETCTYNDNPDVRQCTEEQAKCNYSKH